MPNIFPFAVLSAHAVYDRRTDGYFGRVNVYYHGRLAFYRIVRVCRVCKSDAMQDAMEAIKESRATGKLTV